MTIVREIADAVHMLAEVIKDTRELAKAIQDGRQFFAREHPDAKVDLMTMLSQMQTTVEGLARVTKVVTGFRFTTKGADVDHEPARFNAYLIEQKTHVAALRGDIRKLKGSCDKIREARDKLNELGGNDDWTAMFRLFGAERHEMNAHLANRLSNFYADDQRIVEIITQILKLSEEALSDADAALGPAGTAWPERVEIAAEVLYVYAGAFKESEAKLEALVETLEDTVDELK